MAERNRQEISASRDVVLVTEDNKMNRIRSHPSVFVDYLRLEINSDIGTKLPLPFWRHTTVPVYFFTFCLNPWLSVSQRLHTLQQTGREGFSEHHGIANSG